MSTTKVSAYSSPVSNKTGLLQNEGQDPLDNFIQQAIGKEPFLSFTRPGENPIQWIQLLHAFEQQGNGMMSKCSPNENMVGDSVYQQDTPNDTSKFASKDNGPKKIGNPKTVSRARDDGVKAAEFSQTLKIPETVVAFAQAAAKANGEPEKYLPGWPLVSHPKVQLQKCEKCSREFCSPINYRRHVHVHRRSLNVEKISPKTRELLGAFWDKLSPEETKELASFEDVYLEEVAGSSIIGALTSLLRNPGFSSLPQVYLKAGASILDIVQCRPSRYPISSQELFSILDDASEKTFLCAGTASSLQRFVFDVEVGKTFMETKNLVACTSFLLERKLIKAWLTDKDAEALRCQKLLFEEEEAAQKRQAELLERKRMKKLRQKEQRSRQQDDASNKDGLCDIAEQAKGVLPDKAEGTSCPMEIENQVEVSEDLRGVIPVTCTSHSCPPETGIVDQKWESQVLIESSSRPILPHWPISKSTRNYVNGFHSAQKLMGSRDVKSSSSVYSLRVWTRKSKPERSSMETEKEIKTTDVTASSEVLIGSISVDLKGRNNHQVENKCGRDKITEFDESTVKESRKLLKQVHGEVGVCRLHHSGSEDPASGLSGSEVATRVLQDHCCLSNGGGIDDFSSEIHTSSLLVPETADFSFPRPFSSNIAKAFLMRRWEAAVSADHVKLSLAPVANAKSAGDNADAGEPSTETKHQPAHRGSGEPSSTILYKPRRTKLETGPRLRYIPKAKIPCALE